MYDAYPILIHVTMLHICMMHVPMIRVSMMWCMYPCNLILIHEWYMWLWCTWCIYPWSLILIYACMMYISMFFDPCLDEYILGRFSHGYDAHMYYAFINVPRSSTLMHVCIMHISMILYLGYEVCICVWCMMYFRSVILIHAYICVLDFGFMH